MKKRIKKSPSKVFISNVKKYYPEIYGEEFYSANSIIADKCLMDIEDKGNLFKAIRNDTEAKIVARIDNAVYSFPAVIASPGANEVLIEAYAELNRREKLGLI